MCVFLLVGANNGAGWMILVSGAAINGWAYRLGLAAAKTKRADKTIYKLKWEKNMMRVSIEIVRTIEKLYNFNINNNKIIIIELYDWYWPISSWLKGVVFFLLLDATTITIELKQITDALMIFWNPFYMHHFILPVCMQYAHSNAANLIFFLFI